MELETWHAKIYEMQQKQWLRETYSSNKLILEKKDLKSITLHYEVEEKEEIQSQRKQAEGSSKQSGDKTVMCLSKSGPAATNQRHFSHDQV